MIKHLALVCFAYMAFGFAIGVEMFGFKAGLDPFCVMAILIVSVVFFGIVIFTSMEKIKAILNKDIKPEEHERTTT